MDDPSRMFIGLIIGFVLILIKGFIAACESAVIEVNDAKLKKLAEREESAQRLLKVLSRPNKLIISLSVFKAMTAVTVAIVASLSFFSPLEKKLLNICDNKRTVDVLAILIIVIVTTVLISTFGDNIPKTIAKKNSMDFAIKVSGVLKVIMIIMLPLTALIHLFTSLLGKLFGFSSLGKNQAVTEEEILMMVDAVNETGAIEESQKEMINNIFEFDDLVISDVMTHRTNIIGVEKNTPIREVVNASVSHGFSRIPVYESSIDNIIGIVYIKDLLVLINTNETEKASISDFMRDVMYVPQTNHCRELFKEFTSAKAQIAVVVDEYGGTAGLVSMEDLLEAIVGNIQDEYDDEVEDFVKINDNTYEISGTADPEVVFDELGIELSEDHEYDTMSGLMIDILGYIPAENEMPAILHNGIIFTVLSMDDKRIVKLKAEIVIEEIEDK